MPTYDYECADCGPFSEIRPMAEFEMPQPCPDCGQEAPRLLTAPALSGGAQEASLSTPMRSHAGGCACCAPPPRRMSAEAV
jgi:putative FmdB family regulatory protein